MLYNQLKSKYEEVTDGVLFIKELPPVIVPFDARVSKSLIDIHTPQDFRPSIDKSDGFRLDYLHPIQQQYVESISDTFWLFCWLNPQKERLRINWHQDIENHDMFAFIASSSRADSEGTIVCCFDSNHGHINKYQFKPWTLYYIKDSLLHTSPRDSGSVRLICRWYIPRTSK